MFLMKKIIFAEFEFRIMFKCNTRYKRIGTLQPYASDVRSAVRVLYHREDRIIFFLETQSVNSAVGADQFQGIPLPVEYRDIAKGRNPFILLVRHLRFAPVRGKKDIVVGVQIAESVDEVILDISVAFHVKVGLHEISGRQLLYLPVFQRKCLENASERRSYCESLLIR